MLLAGATELLAGAVLLLSLGATDEDFPPLPPPQAARTLVVNKQAASKPNENFFFMFYLPPFFFFERRETMMIDAPAKRIAAGIMMRAPSDKTLEPLFVALDGLLFVTLLGKPLSKTLPSTSASHLYKV